MCWAMGRGCLCGLRCFGLLWLPCLSSIMPCLFFRWRSGQVPCPNKVNGSSAFGFEGAIDAEEAAWVLHFIHMELDMRPHPDDVLRLLLAAPLQRGQPTARELRAHRRLGNGRIQHPQHQQADEVGPHFCDPPSEEGAPLRREHHYWCPHPHSEQREVKIYRRLVREHRKVAHAHHHPAEFLVIAHEQGVDVLLHSPPHIVQFAGMQIHAEHGMRFPQNSRVHLDGRAWWT
mmetsp:Transcript_5364/g.14438  ORF Transcript_5364/g.14438 Transcript_5364/m.14438 type:complete len:231 (-) Transcript_5364:85-777(-)